MPVQEALQDFAAELERLKLLRRDIESIKEQEPSKVRPLDPNYRPGREKPASPSPTEEKPLEKGPFDTFDKVQDERPGATKDIADIAGRLEQELVALEEVVAGTEPNSALRRFIWLAHGSVGSLHSNLDGITAELNEESQMRGIDVTRALAAVEDLMAIVRMVETAVEKLYNVSKA